MVLGYCCCCCRCYLTMILTLKVTLRFFVLCLVFRVPFTVPSESFALFFNRVLICVFDLFRYTENRSKIKTMLACSFVRSLGLHNCCSCNNESAVIFVCYLNTAHTHGVGVLIKITLMTLACEDGAVTIRTHDLLLWAIYQLPVAYLRPVSLQW